MKHLVCPNCKRPYYFKKQQSHYKYLLAHDTPGCPYRYQVYQDTKKQCIEKAIDYIKRVMPHKKIQRLAPTKMNKKKETQITEAKMRFIMMAMSLPEEDRKLLLDFAINLTTKVNKRIANAKRSTK